MSKFTLEGINEIFVRVLITTWFDHVDGGSLKGINIAQGAKQSNPDKYEISFN